MSKQQRHVVLVSGPAGAGRVTALRALEDLGFEAVDNLPLRLIKNVLEDGDAQPLALGLDTRSRNFDAAHMLELADELRADRSISLDILYLHCDDGVLVRRFSETRRRHPLAAESDVVAGIARDQAMVAPIREAADIFIDTSALNVHELRAELERCFTPETGRVLGLQIASFSYKRGIPVGLDMVFDVRFLRNPHWNAALRPLTGLDQDVAEYVAADENYGAFTTRCFDMIDFLLPAYQAEGKSHFNIGFGCTGGQHRSVALVQALTHHLQGAGWKHITVRHVELERQGMMRARGRI